MKKVKRVYGWKPEVADHRDRVFAYRSLYMPLKVDNLLPDMPIEDQGMLGSCVAHATTAAVEYAAKQTERSRLFVYYYARKLRGWQAQDSGCYIRDAIKVLVKQGVCAESRWPYKPENVFKAPSFAASAAARWAVRGEKSYERIESLSSLKQALVMKQPVAFGFTVTSTFESREVAKTGWLPLPKPNEKVLGGHAVLAVGYNDEAEVPYVIVRNSWSAAWGLNGHFHMPQEWFDDERRLVDDMWTFRLG